VLIIPEPSEKLLRPKEVCRRLGISYSTLSRWVREGRIRAIRTAGGVFRIPESEALWNAESQEEEARGGLQKVARRGREKWLS